MLTNNTQDKLIKGVMIHGPNILEKCLADSKEIQHYLSILENERLDYPKPLFEINPKHWYIPEDYYPNLVEQAKGWRYEMGGPDNCEYQGYFYDETDYDDEDEDLDDEDNY
jgi:hypothetical protein